MHSLGQTTSAADVQRDRHRLDRWAVPHTKSAANSAIAHPVPPGQQGHGLVRVRPTGQGLPIITAVSVPPPQSLPRQTGQPLGSVDVIGYNSADWFAVARRENAWAIALCALTARDGFEMDFCKLS